MPGTQCSDTHSGPRPSGSWLALGLHTSQGLCLFPMERLTSLIFMMAVVLRCDHEGPFVSVGLCLPVGMREGGRA